MTEPNWTEVARQLQEPFDPADVEFRPQGKLIDGRGRAIAYVDARVVAARLDAVIGPGNWAFDWQPVILDNVVRVVKGTLTIYGVGKSDIGDGDKTEVSKAAVSDALKRAAVLWGPGRYLYSLDAERVQGTPGQGDNWYIPDAELKRLRAKLPRPLTPDDRVSGSTRPAPIPSAAPPADPPQRPASAPSAALAAGDDSPRITAAQKATLKSLVARLGWGETDRLDYLTRYAVTAFSALTAAQADQAIADLTPLADRVQPRAGSEAAA